MRAFIGPERLRDLTPWVELIEALKAGFRDPVNVPERMHVDLGGTGSLLIMPAWSEKGLLGLKAIQVFPGNSALGKPAIDGIYMLASAQTGEVLAFIDAQELTARRTAAASALASSYLSRPDSHCHLVLGSGKLAFEVICAHAATRPIERVSIWGRNRDKALAVCARVSKELGLPATVVEDLPAAIAAADIISTVTAATAPILPGRHLRPGTHVDLIGGFMPHMREADDDVVAHARIYVDTQAALDEAGDLVQPLETGVIARGSIRGDLFGLCRGDSVERGHGDITVFKSVGVALEDFAAAGLAWAKHEEELCAHPLR